MQNNTLNNRLGLRNFVYRSNTLNRSVNKQSDYARLGFEPTLSLDFANGILSHEITHSRLSHATMNDAGIIKWAPHNLVCYSEDFNNAYWTKNNVNITDNAIGGPLDYNGGFCQRIIPPTGASLVRDMWEYTDLSPNIPDNTEITVGCYFKKLGSFNAILLATDKEGNIISTSFDIVKGEGIAFTNGTIRYTMDPVPGKAFWYYCTMTYNVKSGASPINTGIGVRFLTATNPNGTLGVLATGFHVYRNDLLVGSNPLTGNSYIKSLDTPEFGPRVGHYINGVNEGLLIESNQKTNMVYPSNDFSSDNYTKSGLSVSREGIGPDGLNSAWKVTATSPGNTIYESITASSSYQAVSLFVKKGNFVFDAGMRIGIYDNVLGVDLGSISFNFDTGEITSYGTVTIAGKQSYANGWYRLWMITPITNNNSIKVFAGRYNTAVAPLGNFHYQYGLQCEVGTLATSSYIPTVTNSVIRAAETVTVARSNIANTSPFTISTSGTISYLDTNSTNQITFLDLVNDANNFTKVKMTTAANNAGKVHATSQVNGTTYNFPNNSLDYFVNNADLAYSTVLTIDANLVYGYSSGITLGSCAAPVPDYSMAPIGLGATMNGTVRQVSYWPINFGNVSVELTQ